jgi:hypothetical protein
MGPVFSGSISIAKLRSTSYAQWKAAEAKIVSWPEDKPWKLREFMAADLDGNLIRVFCDFSTDM